MVRKVPSKLWNTSLVVVSVLGVELYVAVTVQKHQLQMHNLKANEPGALPLLQ